MVNDETNDRMEIKVPCKPEYVRTIRRSVADFAESHHLPRAVVEEIEIAASEAVANIVRHAYPDDHRNPQVRVKCAHGCRGFTIEVIDNGAGFCAPPDGVIPEVDLSRDGGFGIILIKSLMDSVNYVSKPRKGTRIRMTKSASPSIGQPVRRRKKCFKTAS